MTRLFSCALLLAPLVGCTGIHPVGPMAKVLPQPAPKPAPAAPKGGAPSAAAKPPAVLPTPPTALVAPDDVTAANAHALAAKLTEELDADAKATTAPVTAEVSRVKAGPR